MIQKVSLFLALYKSTSKSAIFYHFVILWLLQMAILTFFHNLVISRIMGLFCGRFLRRKVQDSSRVLKHLKNVRVTRGYRQHQSNYSDQSQHEQTAQ